jgi:oligosaccharide translocation protein RFT1
VPLGALLSAGVPTMVFFANGLTKADPYAQAVALYGLAAFLELLAEPFYIRAQRRSKFKLRLVTETIATLSRSFVTFVLVTRPATGITVPLAFAFGQLAYGTCVWLMFAAAQWEFVGEGIDLMLGRSSISWGTLTLLGTFTLQVRSNFDDSIDLHERLYLCALFALTHHPVMNSSIVSCRRCGNFYYLKGRREY